MGTSLAGKLPAHHLFKSESGEGAGSKACVAGTGKAFSCVFRGLVGLDSVSGHCGASASYVFATSTQRAAHDSLHRMAKPHPRLKGVFPGVNHQGVCLPSREGRENPHFRKRSLNAWFTGESATLGLKATTLSAAEPKGSLHKGAPGRG